MENKTLLKTTHLTKRYGSGHTQVTAVNDVFLEMKKGELVLIMGPSGSGKTTLLSMLGGLLKPSEGKVEIDGVEISGMAESDLPDIRARKIGFIFQAFNLLDALTVEENILFPAQLVPQNAEAAKARAQDLIKRLGLSARQKAYPATLSGGEKQRVAIARALINQPPIVLADEPTGNLDSQSGQEVIMELHDIARAEGRSILLVTHDPRVEDVADRILWLEDGKLSDRKQEKHHWVNCPVCHMKVDEWTAVYKANFQAKEYVLCSEKCQKRFQENPAQFAG